MSDESGRPFSAAAQRNREPILRALRMLLRGDETVLEIGSGTGQHAVHFAGQLPGVTWLISDLPTNHDGIRAWTASVVLPNLHGPLALDVTAAEWSVPPVDAVYSANTAHIMSFEQVGAMFRGVAALLPGGGPFLLYGPFMRSGVHTSDSNRDFDAMLRARDPVQGLRDIDELVELAGPLGLALERELTMPANNLLLLWRRLED